MVGWGSKVGGGEKIPNSSDAEVGARGMSPRGMSFMGIWVDGSGAEVWLVVGEMVVSIPLGVDVVAGVEVAKSCDADEAEGCTALVTVALIV